MGPDRSQVGLARTARGLLLWAVLVWCSVRNSSDEYDTNLSVVIVHQHFNSSSPMCKYEFSEHRTGRSDGMQRRYADAVGGMES